MQSAPVDPILVVDDDPTCCRSMADTLETAGYRVEATTDATAACERARTGRYALVVTDFAMPGLLGTALLTQIRQTHPDMPAVLVSGFPDPRTLAEARALGVPVLPKPISRETMLSVVATLLGRGIVRSIAP